MTIKEIEARTGLARANIRYYESQGLVSPVRRENGYRDYSQQDADTLLKVKLLRQLHLSLEDIQALQKGEQELGPVLERTLRELEWERQELDGAVQLCRTLRQDETSYATLDAARYLDRCVPAAQVPEQDQLPHYVFPWRRYFARGLDFSIYTAAVTLLMQLIFRINILRNEAAFWRTLLPLLLMLGCETLMLSRWGTTPGKRLLGLKLVQIDGSPLTLEQAFWRTGCVMLFFGGCQLLYLLPALFELLSAGLEIYACICVYHQRPLFWDRDDILYLEGSQRHKPFWDWDSAFTTLRIGAYLVCGALCMGLVAAGYLWASAPPHRGEQLNAFQFAENFNALNRFTYGRENVAQELDGSGTLRDLPEPEGVFRFILMDDGGPDPVFRFVQGEGGLEEVTLLRSYEGVEGSPRIPRWEAALAAQAFLWHDLGRKQVVELSNALYERQDDFHFSYPNAEVDVRMNDGGKFVFTMTRTQVRT